MKKKKATKKISSKKSVQTDPLISKRKKGESFFEDVYDVVRQIPKGRVTSYGAIANFLGTKSSARMVGWAMNGCAHVTPKVPAHRVVNRLGMLSGKAHFNPPSKMEEQLLKEGIKVKKEMIVDFEKHFWDPAKELLL
ncbi:MAG: MGMT family protein [Sphingobacteriales bacterium]|nr:MGMT family protein [Sphingobacteriales bacterium]MBI3718182.1 MGMT family protein [Sphingobacteriales bacterium]